MLQTAIFEILAIWLGLVAPSVATVIGAEAGILLNFTLNNWFAFGDIATRHSVLMRLARFHLVVSGAVLIQFICVYLTENATTDIVLLHLAYGGSIILSFFWNYTWYRLWIWRYHASSTKEVSPRSKANP